MSSAKVRINFEVGKVLDDYFFEIVRLGVWWVDWGEERVAL